MDSTTTPGLIDQGQGSRIDPDLWPACLVGIELVWHRANRSHDLARFLRSDVRWAECDARIAPDGNLVASHNAGRRGDRPLPDWLREVADAGRAAKIDIKEAGPALDGVIEAADAARFAESDLWFNGALEIIGGERGCRLISHSFPGARLSLPIDTISPWLLVEPVASLELLESTRPWGVERLSISVGTPAFDAVLRIVQRRGWTTNVWDVRTPVQLRDALRSRPDSITADLGVLTAYPSEIPSAVG